MHRLLKHEVFLGLVMEDGLQCTVIVKKKFKHSVANKCVPYG